MRYRRNPDVSITEVEKDLFLVVPESDKIVHLDDLTSSLWRLLEQPTTQAEMIEVLIAAFPEAQPVQIREDLERILAELKAEGVILSLAP